METFSAPMTWMIGVLLLPVLWALWRHAGQTRRAAQARAERLREDLAAFKLEVARGYASIAYLKDVEQRLTGHLLRIERKPDAGDK